MRIFGGIIPFIGWRQINVDNEGLPCDGPSHLIADSFEVEWFGFGAILYIGEVYPRERT